jgi:altronate hydrolase
MYGVTVGRAHEPIARGRPADDAECVHDAADFHSKTPATLGPLRTLRDGRAGPSTGIIAPDGQVGTRNYWLVLPLVFCENRNVDALREAFEEELGYGKPKAISRSRSARCSGSIAIPARRPPRPTGNGAQPSRIFPNVDGIKFLLHQGGCGGTRDDSRALCGLLAGYIHHPNVAGATVLSLGCQNAQVSDLLEELKLRDPSLSKPVLIFDQQQSGLESDDALERHSRDLSGAGRGQRDRSASPPAFQAHRGLEMRRLGWLLRHLRQPGHRPCLRYAGRARRQVSALRVSRAMRREQNLIDRASTRAPAINSST